MSIGERRANNCVTTCTLHLARRYFKAVSKLWSRGDLCISLLCNPAGTHEHLFMALGLHFAASFSSQRLYPWAAPAYLASMRQRRHFGLSPVMTGLGVARSLRCNGPFCTTVRFVGEDNFVFQTFGVVSFYRFSSRISTALTRRRVPHSSTWSTALTRRRAPHSSRWICFASTCKQSIAGKSWPQVMPAILNCDVVSPLGRVTLSGCVFAEYHVQHPEASLHLLASTGYSSFGFAA